ncbi:MAG: hypothetical protein F2561_05760, partial [Actinobacteria bacterium]|nr:hypothetical protein [Actinomycetota bacterium]
MSAAEIETPTDRWPMGYLDQHRDLLIASAIDPLVAQERGYRSVTEKSTLQRCYFSKSQVRVPGLLIPLHSVTGQNAGYQFRPDSPRYRNGKPVKYET